MAYTNYKVSREEVEHLREFIRDKGYYLRDEKLITYITSCRWEKNSQGSIFVPSEVKSNVGPLMVVREGSSLERDLANSSLQCFPRD